MRTKLMLVTLAVAAATAFAGGARAADTNDGAGNPPDRSNPMMPEKSVPNSGMMHGGAMMRGDGMMHGDGMMRGDGMMGMMDRCGQMMGGSASVHLPPGNEKLELQMQAEIMQKTGEILAKYADRIGGETKRTP